MVAMTARPERARRRALWTTLAFPAGVLAVHQLRYLFAYGSDAGRELRAHGDDYVATAAVVVIVLLLTGCAVGLVRLVAARHGRLGASRSAIPSWLQWLCLTLALLAGFCALEAIEMVLEPQHPAGFAGVFDNGGWTAVPAAAAVGALLALLGRGGRVLLAIAAGPPRAAASRPNSGSRRPRLPDRPALPTPLAACAAGRAPPALG